MLCQMIGCMAVWLVLFPPAGLLGRPLGEWKAMLESRHRTERLLAAHVLAIYADAGPLASLAESKDPAARYWFAVGVRHRRDASPALLEACVRLLEDEDLVTRLAAAAALLSHNRVGGDVEAAFRSALKTKQPGILLEALTSLYEQPSFARRFRAEIEAILNEGNANPYEVRTLARKVLDAASAAE